MKTLGDILIEEGIISEKDLEDSLKVQEKKQPSTQSYHSEKRNRRRSRYSPRPIQTLSTRVQRKVRVYGYGRNIFTNSSKTHSEK
ncbi:hypothetical protein LEP1GSC067_1123 [Leptospira interrogans serovar Lora str. TE 1992]|uniref:Uncharacterized protein n=1 Tax=Leptospira interrogans serovar Lora str. TE 1992 TaxID=1193028 RepID=M3F2M4_LEPIR|nr:hypothetical protein LEP1GSC067_1123 [Leptospira interrogans serovar Lora str. TE 1992]